MTSEKAGGSHAGETGSLTPEASGMPSADLEYPSGATQEAERRCRRLGFRWDGTSGRAAPELGHAAHGDADVAALVASAERGEDLVADGAGGLGEVVHALMGSEDLERGRDRVERA